MDNSKRLAALIGPTLAALGIMVLFNQPVIAALVNDASEGPMFIIFSGILVFVAGLAILLAHHRWVKGWPVIITVGGWLGILAGLARMWFPVQLLAIASHILALGYVLPLAGIFILVIGAFLSFKAYSR